MIFCHSLIGKSSVWHPHTKIYGICIFNNRVGLGLELGLGLLLGLGLGNYAIFGWGCHKELFPMAPFAKDEEEESIWLKWEWLEIVAKLSDFPELVDPIMIS